MTAISSSSADAAAATWHDAVVPDAREDAAVAPVAATRAAKDRRLRLIVENHYDFIWRMLRRFGVPSQATEDAAQEVFLVAARKVDRIKPGSERAFLFGTAMRVAAELRRHHARKREVSEPEHIEGLASNENPEHHLSRRQARALLDEVLAAMADDLRQAFVLFELEELEIKEIAELVGIPIGTVGSRLRRARKEFTTIAGRLRARLRFAERNAPSEEQ